MSTLTERLTYDLTQVEPKPIEWIWEGRLARGTLTILESDPGMGKGLIAMDIAARLTRGEQMPCDETSRIQYPKHIPECLNRGARVLLCTTEDSRALTQRARAEAAGANLSQIRCMDPGLQAGYQGGMEAVREVINILQRVIHESKCALVIIDPLFGFLQALSCATEKDARYALTALSFMAEHANCAILAIRHLNKSTSKAAIYRGSGSIAFTGVARIVLTLLPSPSIGRGAGGEGQTRIIACVKNNMSARPPAIAYTIVPTENNSAKVEWQGPSETDIDPLQASSRTPGPKQTVLPDARNLLLEILSKGPTDEAKIRRQAEDRGISQTTLRRAKTALGVRSTRIGSGRRRWQWSLPPS